MRAIVTVLGKDRVGIIAEVCSILAGYRVNILDISQTILQDYFTMVMLVDASACPIPFVDLVSRLQKEGVKTQLDIRVQREEIFNTMHRI